MIHLGEHTTGPIAAALSPPRPFPRVSIFPRVINEADTHIKMRLAIAGAAAATPTLVPVCRSEECTEKHHTT